MKSKVLLCVLESSHLGKRFQGYTPQASHSFTSTKCLTVNCYHSLIPAAHLYEKPGKMHCVFQISQKNSACTASLGYWKMQDLPSCIRWQTHLVLYVFDRTARSLAAPSGKTVHTLIRIGGSWTRAHQRYLSSMLQLPCLEATYLSDPCSNQFCTSRD